MQQRCVQDSSISSQKKTGIKRKLDTDRQDVEGQRQMDSLRRRMKVSELFTIHNDQRGGSEAHASHSQREGDVADGYFMTQLLKLRMQQHEADGTSKPRGVVDVSQSLARKAWSPLCIAQNSKVWSMEHSVMLSGAQHLALQGWPRAKVEAAKALPSNKLKEMAGEGMVLQKLGMVMMCFWLNVDGPWWQTQ